MLNLYCRLLCKLMDFFDDHEMPRLSGFVVAVAELTTPSDY